jgi:hypothetical protein
MNRLFLVFILMLSTVLYAGKAQPYRSINNEYFKRGKNSHIKLHFIRCSPAILLPEPPHWKSRKRISKLAEGIRITPSATGKLPG